MTKLYILLGVIIVLIFLLRMVAKKGRIKVCGPKCQLPFKKSQLKKDYQKRKQRKGNSELFSDFIDKEKRK